MGAQILDFLEEVVVGQRLIWRLNATFQLGFARKQFTGGDATDG